MGEERRGEERERGGEGRKGRMGVGNVVMLLSACGELLRPVQTEPSILNGLYRYRNLGKFRC